MNVIEATARVVPPTHQDFTIDVWRDCFPFDNVRPQQEEAINHTLDAFFNKGKRFVVVQAAVGIGKSAIAMTVANYFRKLEKKSYVLSTQNVLTQQYMDDFGAQGLMKLKSASSYTCQKHDCGEKQSCIDVKRLIKTRTELKPLYTECEGSGCRYQTAKDEFFAGYEGITNYAYFLATNAHSYVKMPFRDLLILDETHNIESQVGSFVEVSFSNHFYKKVLDVKMPPMNAPQEDVYKWLTVRCEKKLRALISDKKAAAAAHMRRSEDAIAAAEEIEGLERNLGKLRFFKSMYDPKTWVLDALKTDKRGERIYEFKPLDVSRYARSLLFDYAERTLMLSATVINPDAFCDSVGISTSDVAYIDIPSPFPVENRQVHYLPVGSMSRKNIDMTLPQMVQMIETLLEQHANEKGIIHTGTFRIAQFLIENVKSDRLFVHNSENRNEVLQHHFDSERPTVLLSPSMTEGVDLVGERSRFQVLCKIPYPYLGDPVVERKSQMKPDWYPYQTAKTIIQALGRSVRTETDWATSYILDADWSRFYRQNGHLFPNDFKLTLK